MASTLVLKTISAGISQAEGFGPPSNLATKNCNPGDLKNSAATNPNRYPTDSQGHIIYPTIQEGQGALEHQINLMLTPGAKSVYNPNMTLVEVGKHYATDPNWAKNVAAAIDGGKGIITANTKLSDIQAYIDSG